MFYYVQQGSRYILSLTNQRSWFEIRRLQRHHQIKAHGQHMVNKTWLERGKKVVMLFGQRNRWRVSSICMIMSSLSGFSILAGTICKQTAWNMLLDLVCKPTRIMIQKIAWYKYRDTCFTVYRAIRIAI
jgi:hypothetical protein